MKWQRRKQIAQAQCSHLLNKHYYTMQSSQDNRSRFENRAMLSGQPTAVFEQTVTWWFRLRLCSRTQGSPLRHLHPQLLNC
jgi:hypothetical protein